MRPLTLSLIILCIITPLTTIKGEPLENATVFQLNIETNSDWNTIKINSTQKIRLIEYKNIEKDNLENKITIENNEIEIIISKETLEKEYINTKIYFIVLDDAPEIGVMIKKGFIGTTNITLNQHTNNGFQKIKEIIHKNNLKKSDTNPFSEIIKIQENTTRTFPLKINKVSPRKATYAFYYPWYSTPEGPERIYDHWIPEDKDNIDKSADYPLLDIYDSQELETQKTHINMAKEAGIDGFICSWNGINTTEDKAIESLVKLAEEYDFKISIYYESLRGNQEELMDKKQITDELVYIINKHRNKTGYLHLNGIPVIFIYQAETPQRSPEFWEEVLQKVEEKTSKVMCIGEFRKMNYYSEFEGVHTYNELNLETLKQITTRYNDNKYYSTHNSWNTFIQSLNQTGFIEIDEKIRVGTVVPGYDDTEMRTPGQYLPRDNLTTYRQYWENIHTNNLDWVVITSFNEWHEGTEIEPSKEYGFTYLQETQKQTNKHKDIENYAQKSEAELQCNYENGSINIKIQNTGHCALYKININETNIGKIDTIKVLEPLESYNYKINIGNQNKQSNYSFNITYYSLSEGYQQKTQEYTIKPKEIQPKIELTFTNFNLTQIEHQTIVRASILVNSTPPQLDYCSLDILLDDKLVHGESWSNYPESTHSQITPPIEIGYNFMLEPLAGNHSIKLRAYAKNNLTYKIFETENLYFQKLDQFLKLDNTNITLQENNQTLRVDIHTEVNTYPSKLEYASIDLLLNNKIIWSECWSKNTTNPTTTIPKEVQLTYEFPKPGGAYKLTTRIYARNTAKIGNCSTILIKQEKPDHITELQNYVLRILNEYRKQNNRPPLDLSESKIAQEYAEEMLKSNEFKHNPDLARGVAENIAMMRYYRYYYTEEEAIARMIYLMMYEDEAHNWGHRYNILNYYYETTSIGVAYDETYIYLVQNFFKP